VNGSCGDKTGGPGEWPETGEMWAIASQNEQVFHENYRRFQRRKMHRRVTEVGSHRWTKGLVATVGSLLGNITSRSGVSMTTSIDWDREVLGLSRIASKVSALYWLVEETVEVLADVMAWAANNIESLVSPARIGGWMTVVRISFIESNSQRLNNNCALNNSRTSIGGIDIILAGIVQVLK